MAYNKWIVGGVGWAFGGPIGAVLGFAIGALLDHMQGPQQEELPPQPGGSPGKVPPTLAGDMALSLVVLTAAMMKADGRATRQELDLVRRFFVQQFGTRTAGEMLRTLRDVLQRDIPIHQVCEQVRHNMPHAMRLQLMHFLIGVAHADGQVHRAEVDLLARIASELGISEKDLGSLSAMFRKPSAASAYQILEITEEASDDEVKKAYRRMAMKYHPDKVLDLGEEFQKAAAEKFRKVQEAYERISVQRGIK